MYTIAVVGNFSPCCTYKVQCRFSEKMAAIISLTRDMGTWEPPSPFRGCSINTCRASSCKFTHNYLHYHLIPFLFFRDTTLAVAVRQFAWGELKCNLAKDF